MTSNNDKSSSDNGESEMPFGLSVHNHESTPKYESEDPPSNEEKRKTTKSYGTIDDDAETGDTSQQESPPETDATTAPPVPLHKRIWQQWCKFYNKNSFLVLVVCAILIAYAYPPLGAEYLRPDITATWIAVLFIFVLAGMGIKTEEFAKAFQRLYFNVFLQVFNFGVVSGIVYGFSRFMLHVNALPQSLADGMTICASLPITVNMVLVLTKSAGGDEASAIFNAAFGNLVGVFLSPALILGYLGVKGEINLGDVFFKLGLRVVLPIAVGQFLQKFVQPAKEFVKKYKKYFKTAQEYCLVFIVYTVFCKTFKNGSDASAGDVFLMIALQFLILGFVMVLAWFSLRMLFRKEPTLQAMGLFGCTHKTVAMGVPLINAIYEDNPLVGMYTLPLLIWHPMQLVLGTAVAPHVAAYVKTKQELLARERVEEENKNTEDTVKTMEMGATVQVNNSTEHDNSQHE